MTDTDPAALTWQKDPHSNRHLAHTSTGTYVILNTPGGCLVGHDGRHIAGSPRIDTLDQAKAYAASHYADTQAAAAPAPVVATHEYTAVEALRAIRSALDVAADEASEGAHMIIAFDSAVADLGINL